MTESEIPWDEIAFPTVLHSLRYFYADRAEGVARIHTLDLSAKPRRPRDREVSEGDPIPGQPVE